MFSWCWSLGSMGPFLSLSLLSPSIPSLLLFLLNLSHAFPTSTSVSIAACPLARTDAVATLRSSHLCFLPCPGLQDTAGRVSAIIHGRISMRVYSTSGTSSAVSLTLTLALLIIQHLLPENLSKPGVTKCFL